MPFGITAVGYYEMNDETEEGAAATHALQGRRSTSKTEGEIVKVKGDELEPAAWELTPGAGQDCPDEDDDWQPISCISLWEESA